MTLTGTVVRIVVLVVTKMSDTAVILIRDVGRTLTQLSLLAVCKRHGARSGNTYKSGSEFVAVNALGTGANTVRTSPAIRVYFPFTYSRAFPVPIEAMNPIAPIGRKRRAVSPADRLSTCCAIRTM